MSLTCYLLPIVHLVVELLYNVVFTAGPRIPVARSISTITPQSHLPARPAYYESYLLPATIVHLVELLYNVVFTAGPRIPVARSISTITPQSHLPARRAFMSLTCYLLPRGVSSVVMRASLSKLPG